MKGDGVLSLNGKDMLKVLMEENNWTAEEVATAIGDSPLRIYRVLEGDESLGRTAELALLAVYNNCQPVEK